MSQSSYILRGHNKILEVVTPLVMGIVNLTPDSFYKGSRAMEISQVVDNVGQMISTGADIIDLGGMSTRPGADTPSISEELDRLTGPLMAVRAAFPDIFISIDTYRTEVLKACLDLRIDMINDVTGGTIGEDFLEVVARSGLPYVLMHMQGIPKNMQEKPAYEDVVLDLMKFIDARLHHCKSLGITDIIIDPGFGFGKTIEDNYTLLAHLSSFRIFDHPILVGLSRKSMIYKAIDKTPTESLNATTAAHMLALNNGASILRVHDVKEARECIDIWRQYQKGNLHD